MTQLEMPDFYGLYHPDIFRLPRLPLDSFGGIPGGGDKAVGHSGKGGNYHYADFTAMFGIL
jgi:hypothetical protein